MVNQSTGINEVKAFIRLCEQKGLSIEKAFLFGSYARKEMKEESDIDLILVSRQFCGNRFFDAGLYARANISFPKIEVRTYSSQQFSQGSDFLNHVLKDAISLK